MFRRKFIRDLSLTAGLASIAPNLPLSQVLASEDPKPPKNLGIALVGLGSYATGELAPALSKTNRCHLAGLVSGTAEKRTRYGETYAIDGAHIYDYQNYAQLAEDDAIDIVYVVLPNSMHAEYSIRAAEAGKHVICEKPMAVSTKECRKMIDACKANGVTLNVGYRLHHDPYHEVFRQMAEEQPHGPAKFIQAAFCFRTGDPKQWRLKKALAGGGAMMDVGIYCIQAARYCTGEEPIAVTAREYKTDPVKFAEVDETIVWEMEFPSGAIASCNTSYNYRAERLHVAYRDDNFEGELSPAFIYRNLKGRLGRKTLDFGNPPQQALHMDAIAESITSGTPSTTTGIEGLRDMTIIEAIYKSIAEEGERIKIPPVSV